MGKRLALLMTIIASAVSSFGGLIPHSGPEISAFDSFYALHTQAQGLSATVAAHQNALVSNDSVTEVPSVASTETAAKIQVKPQPLDVWVTAYTSSPDETDDTPYITASGSLVHDGVAATNFLPMGTRFRIPMIFGDKVFTVEDRMNARYDGVKIVDVWMGDKQQAIDFGKVSVKIELL